jgi:large subunit ribosomal protein L24
MIIMRKIRKGDEVIVITGKDKGKIGSVLQVIIGRNDKLKVVVEGVCVVKKHVKPNPMKEIVGGIIEKNMPIDISNVAIYNGDTKKADRVGFKVENGQKVRYFKSTGNVIG